MQAERVASLAGVVALTRAVARVSGEVLEPHARVAVPTPAESWAHPVERQPEVIYVQVPQPVVEDGPKPSKVMPWALIMVAACILVYACFASWHTWVGPQLSPVRSHQVDLVGPSR